jgi:DNA-binding LacI/PurR family transcriptional regulator
MHRLLAAPLPPTAVFARTDILAMGALRAIRDMGLRVPEDISLIGHDDIRLAELSDPPLTTVRIDTGRIGRMATEALLKCLEGSQPALKDSLTGESVKKSVVVGSVVETQLIVRSSTGPYLPDVAIAHDRRASERQSLAEQDHP